MNSALGESKCGLFIWTETDLCIFVMLQAVLTLHGQKQSDLNRWSELLHVHKYIACVYISGL